MVAGVSRNILVIAFVGAFAGIASGQTPPRFEDYPVAKKYTGKSASLILTRDDRMFRTRLREAAKRKPNFAGHYILTTWGCGAECVMVAIIDAQTGRVYFLPFTLRCWGADLPKNFEPVSLRLDSRLIIFSGAQWKRKMTKAGTSASLSTTVLL